MSSFLHWNIWLFFRRILLQRLYLLIQLRRLICQDIAVQADQTKIQVGLSRLAGCLR